MYIHTNTHRFFSFLGGALGGFSSGPSRNSHSGTLRKQGATAACVGLGLRWVGLGCVCVYVGVGLGWVGLCVYVFCVGPLRFQ